MAAPSDPASPTLIPPFLGQSMEICIVTGDLKATLIGLCKLGIGPFKIFHFSPSTVSSQTLRGQPGSFELNVAFAAQGSMVWEVMQPVAGHTIMQQFLDSTGGKGGIHHVAFDCATEPGNRIDGFVGDNARAEAVRRRTEFERRGFAMVMGGVWKGKRGTCEFMFFGTEGAVNTCFETYVFSDDWEDPDDVEMFPSESISAIQES